MSKTAIDSEDVFDVSEDQAYFLRLEATFLALRGSPLNLSPKDWQIAKKWRQKGIPADLVERILHEIFERRLQRGQEDKVWSLQHCKRAVEAAWRRQQELLAPAESGDSRALDTGARLQALADSLPAELAERDSLARRILALSGDAEQVEGELLQLDQEMMRAATATLDSETRRQLAAELEASSTALASRLPAAELERARERLEQQWLRRRQSLPMLSLFAVNPST